MEKEKTKGIHVYLAMLIVISIPAMLAITYHIYTLQEADYILPAILVLLIIRFAYKKVNKKYISRKQDSIDYYQVYREEYIKKEAKPFLEKFLQGRRIKEWEQTAPDKVLIDSVEGKIEYVKSLDGIKGIKVIRLENGKTLRPKKAGVPEEILEKYYREYFSSFLQAWSIAIQDSPEKSFTFNLQETEGKKVNEKDCKAAEKILRDQGFLVSREKKNFSLRLKEE